MRKAISRLGAGLLLALMLMASPFGLRWYSVYSHTPQVGVWNRLLISSIIVMRPSRRPPPPHNVQQEQQPLLQRLVHSAAGWM